ncbi:MAG: hypothetical protein ACNA7H_04855 [Desulfotignum sp.]
MQKMETETGEKNRKQGGLRGWLRLAVGLAMIWAMAYVILPWGSTLPVIAPIMQAIADSEIDAGAYWYTQSEETAIAQMYVRHAIDGRRD